MLHTCNAVSGTDIAYDAVCQRPSDGTEIGYAGTTSSRSQVICPICPRYSVSAYAMSCTDIGFAATSANSFNPRIAQRIAGLLLFAYVPAMRCPSLTHSIVVSAYARAMRFPVLIYNMVVSAMRCPVLTRGMGLPEELSQSSSSSLTRLQLRYYVLSAYAYAGTWCYQIHRPASHTCCDVVRSATLSAYVRATQCPVLTCISLRAYYAMSGTEPGYAATRPSTLFGPHRAQPGISARILLRVRYAVSGTDRGYADTPTVLRCRYAISGTDLGYAAPGRQQSRD
eukprot:1642601-Rhodomonas_salina.8